MSNLPDNIQYLDVEDVLRIHARAIADHGGTTGIRDMPLLESAIAAPQASLGGKSLYSDLIETASAYLYFICRNHPFLDGNKRAALGSCITFLEMNGYEIFDEPAWEDLTLRVAEGAISREEAASRVRQLTAK